jgi:hypothetical protein
MTDLSIRLHPRKTYSSQWMWYAVLLDGLEGCAPEFYLARADHAGLNGAATVAVMRYACWAYALDTDSWASFDNFTVGATDFVFSNDRPFSGPVYVAALPMLPTSKISRLVEEYALSSYVSETPSSSSYIIGYATERLNVDGRTVPALPFYAFKITDPTETGSKNKAVLFSGNHPGETAGHYTFHGAIEFLLGETSEAHALRTWFNFYCYPNVNPQGRWGGLWRSSPQRTDLDHNRQWLTTGTLETVDTVKPAVLADTGGSIEVGLDFHSYYWVGAASNNGYDYGSCLVDSYEHAAFRAAMRTYQANYELCDPGGSGFAREWFASALNGSGTLKVAISSETSPRRDTGIADWMAYGANQMRALHTMLQQGKFGYGP